MNIPHEHFCPLPWISLEASPIGTVRPCCLADNEIVDDSGNKCRLNTHDFNTIRQTQHMSQLRQEFLAGKQPETCRRCWAEEDAGRTSKRMHTLERLKHLPLNSFTEELQPLMFIDFKLGNICNLKCRICGSWSSSTYATEELKFTARPKESFHYTMLREGAWPRSTPEFWAELEQYKDQLRYLEFTGGEPFMIREHFDLLEQLVAQGLAKNIEIHYNTNGTQWPDAAEDIWRHFKHVEIAFSIDDVGSRFEYQRSGADWANVNANIDSYIAMRDRNRNISLQVCSTVNVFNVYYLLDVAQWINNKSFDFVYWNILHDAPQFSIANLSVTAKQAIAQHLNSQRFPKQFNTDIQGIINFMNNSNNDLTEELIKSIQQVDRRRNESLKQVSPELARLLNYEN
jgi:organic radical activating enzyme